MAVLAAGAAVAAAFHAASPAAETASGVAVLSSPAAGHIFINSYNLRKSNNTSNGTTTSSNSTFANSNTSKTMIRA